MSLPREAFRTLDPGETEEFREWARLNYKPGDPIDGIWHPEIREECNRMNREMVAKLRQIINCEEDYVISGKYGLPIRVGDTVVTTGGVYGLVEAVIPMGTARIRMSADGGLQTFVQQQLCRVDTEELKIWVRKQLEVNSGKART